MINEDNHDMDPPAILIRFWNLDVCAGCGSAIGDTVVAIGGLLEVLGALSV